MSVDSTNCDSNQVAVVCPVCACSLSQFLFCAPSWESFARDQVYEVRRCTNCHAAFTSPTCSGIDQAFYTQGLYQDTRNRLYLLIEALSRGFQRSRLRKIARARRPPGRLLDVGCGKGRFLAYAATRNWDVLGVEPSESSRICARARLGDRVLGSLDELHPYQRFDIVTLWHVLEHVFSPVQMLRQIRSHMCAEGLLFVAVPNFSSFQARLGRKNWSHLDVPRHRLHFSPEVLAYTLTLAGYTPLWVDHFSVEFNPIGVLQTALNLLGCEPGLLYAFVKGGYLRGGAAKRSQFVRDVLAFLVGVPVLALPALLFACLESLIGRGGTVLVCAKLSGARLEVDS